MEYQKGWIGIQKESLAIGLMEKCQMLSKMFIPHVKMFKPEAKMLENIITLG
jgi:hypothetical protein